MQHLLIGVAELIGNEQGHHRSAESAPLLGRAQSLGIKESIENTYIRTTLPGIVLKVEQLESCHIRCAQVHLDVLLVEA